MLLTLPPGFEVFRDSYIYVGVWAWSGSFVDNVFSVAMASEWAFFPFGFLAITLFAALVMPLLVLLQYLFVVCLYYLLNISSTAVRDFECVFVQNGLKHMVWGEVFFDHFQKASAQFYLQRLVERWSKENCIPLLPCAILGLTTGGLLYVFLF